MLGNLRGLGNSACGLTPLSWRQAYTGMIRTIALWGAEVGLRGQEKWWTSLRSLQYQSLRNCSGVLQGTAHNAINMIIGVESIETKDGRHSGTFRSEKYVQFLSNGGFMASEF